MTSATTEDSTWCESIREVMGEKTVCLQQVQCMFDTVLTAFRLIAKEAVLLTLLTNCREQGTATK